MWFHRSELLAPLTSLISSKVKFEWHSKQYTTTERELLSAIETCKEYTNTLLGYPITVFTDNKNNTFNGLKASDRVLRWFLLLEEYGVTFEYLPGKKNVGNVADALSRFDIHSLKNQEEELLTVISGSENNSISNIKYQINNSKAYCFDLQEQAKVKGLKEKFLGQNHYPVQHIEGYDLIY
jgi:hypothetical protein